jgi:hypothetical protein
MAAPSSVFSALVTDHSMRSMENVHAKLNYALDYAGTNYYYKLTILL